MTFGQIIFFICLSSVAVSYSSARPNVLPTFCAEGQVAWCHNLTTAADCNAVQHCLQTVWLTQKSLTAGSCGSCEAQIQKIRQTIDSNTTKEVIQELLEHICSFNFITELFRKRCERYVDNYVDSYFNELLDLLKSDISPAAVCHILGFCSSVDSSTGFDDTVVSSPNILINLPNPFHTPTLVGAGRCSWGPAHWCHNLTSSKECGSTELCISNVWSKLQYPNDDNSVCKVCKDMVQQARDQLQSNETQEELREVLDGSCKLIPIKEVRNECIKLADDFKLELTEMLSSEMNPTVVCTVAGLCNSPHIDALLKAESADSCTNCMAALTTVERYLEAAPPSQVFDKFVRLCDQFSTYSEFCVDMLTSNFDHIYEILVADMRPFTACHVSSMCAHVASYDTSLQANVDSMLANANDDLPCDLCKQLVKHVKDELTTNTTDIEFLAILRGFCQHTKSFKAECLQIVNNNFQKFYKFLTEELSPEGVCKEVNLCPKKDFISDENLQLIDHGVFVPAVLTELSVATPVASPECQFCKMLIKLAQKEMKKPEYRHDIKKLLGRICSLVPRMKRNSCNQFIQKHGDALIKLLVEQTNPGTICTLLGQCLLAPAVRNELCPICQDVMHYLEEQMQSSEEQEKVEEMVRKICRIMPAHEQNRCKSFINDYTSLILNVLSTELDPSLVCHALRLCSPALSPLERCNHCQCLIGNMTILLDGNQSKDDVMSALHSLVPAKNSDSFLTALQLKINHGDDIADMMVAEFDAQESCIFLHFCEPDMAGASAVEVETNDIEVTTPLTKPSCELCELMVQLYFDKLTSNATEAEIEADLQKFCAKIKNPEFRSNCSHFVQKYVPEVIKLLKNDVTPKQVCSLVKLCPLQFDLVGYSRCEFCEAVVGSLEALSADPRTMTKSIKYLFAICNVFQKPNEHATCMKIIANVGPQLEGVALSIPSWFYCSKMQMCPYGAHLSYKQVCSDQSQWCADVTKAVLCDQLAYCQESVWMSDAPSL